MPVRNSHNVNTERQEGICNNEKLISANCTQIRTDCKIALAENGKTYLIDNINSEKIAVIKLDGCLSPADEQSADHLILRCDKNAAYFVELKGSDLSKACAQVLHSLRKFSGELRNTSKHARIVIGKVRAPAISSNNYKELKKFCVRNTISFRHGSIILKEKYE